jgi:predicted site-specific integrase-resolvase
MCSNVSSFHQRKDHTKINYIYTRVSSRKQSDDLERQIEFIKSQKPEYNTSYKLISDIGSGINFKRQGLITILESCLQNNIGEVVIAHKDRLSRFGFDLIKLIIEKAGGKITIINDEQNKSTEQELAEDLLSIIHIYSCRQMGKRKYTKTKN